MWEVSISVYFQWQCILRLHCHWKPSQSGAVLKIALCWPLAGSIYTAFIKAVRVLSIFDLKDGMSGSVSHNIYSSWRSIYELFCWQKKYTGRHKNTRNAVTLLWYRCHVFLGLKRTSSALGTARLQHGCSMDLAQYHLHWQVRRCRAELVPCQLALWKRVGPAQHGLASSPGSLRGRHGKKKSLVQTARACA